MSRSEIPQSQEFARENQFRVELPDIQELYWALNLPEKVSPEESMRAFEIGTSHSEDELFSKINVNAVNAMAKVKGIPQSGKLTLLPPQDIPQL